MEAKFIGCSKDQIAWGGCDDPKGILQVGRIYEVEDVEIHSWHTKYILKGLPGGKFNSVCFE